LAAVIVVETVSKETGSDLVGRLIPHEFQARPSAGADGGLMPRSQEVIMASREMKAAKKEAGLCLHEGCGSQAVMPPVLNHCQKHLPEDHECWIAAFRSGGVGAETLT
jgi:hypothetical protein